MTYKFMLLHRSETADDWSVIEDHANTQKQFLKAVDDHIIRDNEWLVYGIAESNHKDDFIHDGLIEEICTG